MPLPTIRGKALISGSVENQAGPARVYHFAVSGSSAPLRLFDILTLASGVVSRGDSTSASILGFAFEPTQQPEIRQIIIMPNLNDSAGNVRVGAYVAGAGNTFVAATTPGRALAIADVGATCDFAPYIISPTPVITNIGTAGSTTYNYQVTAKTLLGESKSIAVVATTTGNATLSATNYNRVTIPATTNAVSYVIYRGGFFVAEIPAVPGSNTVYNDIGVVVTTAAVPTRNDTGFVVAPAVNSVGIVQIVSLLDPIGTLGGRVRFRVVASKSQYSI